MRQQKTHKKEITDMTDKEYEQMQELWEKAGRMREFKAEYTNKHGSKDSIGLNVEFASTMPARVAYMLGIAYGVEFARSQDAHDKAATDAILAGIKGACHISVKAETKHSVKATKH